MPDDSAKAGAPPFRLSREQKAATVKFKRWLSGSEREFSLGGFAGTGKTVLAVHWMALARRRGLAVGAGCPTNRAARVLANRGAQNTTTLHRILYVPADADEELSALERKRRAKQRKYDGERAESAAGERILREIAELDAKINEKRAPSFLDKAVVDDIDVLFVDEASMVGKQVASDLRERNWRIVWVGDPAQLPPVGEIGGAYHNLRKDALLTKVVRHDDSGLLQFATHARERRSWGRTTGMVRDAEYDELIKIVAESANGSDPLGESSAVALCHTNATRMSVNANVRKKAGRKGHLPQRGEVLQSLRRTVLRGKHNATVAHLHRGARYVVTSIRRMEHNAEDRRPLLATLKGEDGIEFEALVNPWRFEWAAMGCFVRESMEFADANSRMPPIKVSGKKAERMEGATLLTQTKRGSTIESEWSVPVYDFDFGYAMTVHKAQGGEWDTVALFDDHFDREEGSEDYGRWLYTASTRASRAIVAHRMLWHERARVPRDGRAEQKLRRAWNGSSKTDVLAWAQRHIEGIVQSRGRSDDAKAAAELCYMALAGESPRSGIEDASQARADSDALTMLRMACEAQKQNLLRGDSIAPGRIMFKAACDMHEAPSKKRRNAIASKAVDDLRGVEDGASFTFAAERIAG